MNDDVRAAVQGLLTRERVLSVAVLIDGQPEAGLLPFAPGDNERTLLVQASALARHSRGLVDGATVGVLVHASDGPDQDPMQLPRLTVQATVRLVPKATEAFAAGAARYAARFPAAAMTLELGDFNLFELHLGRGRYVEGFARAFAV
jgi:putative heme iron utilization protein